MLQVGVHIACQHSLQCKRNISHLCKWNWKTDVSTVSLTFISLLFSWLMFPEWLEMTWRCFSPILSHEQYSIQFEKLPRDYNVIWRSFFRYICWSPSGSKREETVSAFEDTQPCTLDRKSDFWSAQNAHHKSILKSSCGATRQERIHQAFTGRSEVKVKLGNIRVFRMVTYFNSEIIS